MKFDLLYEIEKIGVVDPQTGIVDPARQRQAFEESLEQVKLADQVGFDTFWLVEHHFLGDFSLSSAPEIFLTAAARETQRIRIGQGVCLLPFGYNHPIRAAERAATLDILSGGRLEFGTGRSATLVEMEPFGVDPERNRGQWDEALRMIVRMWQDGPFEWQSESFRIPPRFVVPKPLQRPHPPLWMAGTQPESIRVAAERGLGLLHFTYSQPEELEKKIALYREVSERCEPVGRKNTRFGAFTMLSCGRDDREALELGSEGITWYMTVTNNLYSALGALPGDSYAWYKEAHRSGAFLGARMGRGEQKVEVDRLADESVVCVGGPDRCEQIVREYERRGVDHMVLMVQHGPTRHDAILDSLRRFGREVIPRFR